MANGLILNLFLVLFAAAAISFDLMQRRIPNWLTFPAMIGGILIQLHNGGAEGVTGSILGLSLGVGILFIPFFFGWVGAGDVKLLGALGAIVGAQSIPRLLFYSVLMAGIVALISLTSRTVGSILLNGPNQALRRAFAKGRTIPYGVGIGLGALLAVFFDPAGRWAGF